MTDPDAVLSRPSAMAGDYLLLDDQQAAAMFRLHTSLPLGACQFEGGRMRWWLLGGLRLELDAGEWRLFMVPPRATLPSVDSLNGDDDDAI